MKPSSRLYNFTRTCWHFAGHGGVFAGKQVYITLQSVKDALISINLESGVGISLAIKVAWILPLIFVPHLFLHNASLVTMKQVMSERNWAVAFLVLVAFDCFVLRSRKFLIHVLGLLVGMMTWFFMSSLLSQQSFHGYFDMPASPGAYTYFLGAALLCYNLIRLCSYHMARQEAERILELENVVLEARIAGEPWAQTLPKSQMGNGLNAA